MKNLLRKIWWKNSGIYCLVFFFLFTIHQGSKNTKKKSVAFEFWIQQNSKASNKQKGKKWMMKETKKILNVMKVKKNKDKN